jgi:hypothetical protein
VSDQVSHPYKTGEIHSSSLMKVAQDYTVIDRLVVLLLDKN